MTTGLQLPAAHAAELVRLLSAGGIDFDRHRPVVFGSRAAGRARRYSDIDVGITGEPLRPKELAALNETLEESALPYRVDVLNFADTSESFRAVALAGAVPLGVEANP